VGGQFLMPHWHGEEWYQQKLDMMQLGICHHNCISKVMYVKKRPPMGIVQSSGQAKCMAFGYSAEAE